METNQMVVYGLIFLLVAGITLLCVSRLLYQDPLKKRIATMDLSEDADFTRKHWLVHVAPITQRLARFSSPEDGRDAVRLMNAGYRSASAAPVYYAAKTGLLVLLPLVAWFFIPSSFSQTNLLLSLLGAAAVGMFLPSKVLDHQIKSRQAKLVDGLPDALEMMRVCVEAGLGFDAAMTRVTREIGGKSPELQQEFELMLYEINAGSARNSAMRKLALRTGVEDIAALTTMLIQADRFGISVGEALKTYTKELREKRQQRGEEKAAKLSVTLMIPMVLFIFPAMFGVLLAPGVLQMVRILMPTLHASS